MANGVSRLILADNKGKTQVTNAALKEEGTENPTSTEEKAEMKK
jgi:hypothetical protein